MFIEDRWLSDYLNLAIYALDPQERWPAHVTVAGPFSHPGDAPFTLNFNDQVHVFGRGRFVSSLRQTIFLHVTSPTLQSRLNKPDFKDAVPHLSLYNGKDTGLAELLYESLSRVRSLGTFFCRNLTVVESSQQHPFDFARMIRPDILPSTRGFTTNMFHNLSVAERVKIAAQAVDFAFNRPWNKHEYATKKARNAAQNQR